MHLFTYGTLMDPAIWSQVAQQECASRPAVLHGYEARRLRDETFPGLVECPCASTEGLLYHDVSAAALLRLDEYESECYVRVELTVEDAAGARMPAQVYLMHPAHRGLVLPERWLPPHCNAPGA